MKKLLLTVIAAAFIFASCAGNAERQDANTASGNEAADTAGILSESTPESASESAAEGVPAGNEELYRAMLEAWEDGRISEMYGYASVELKAVIDEDAFTQIFDGMTETFGSITAYSDGARTASAGYDVYICHVQLAHAKADFTMTFKNTQIAGINYDLRFTDTFEKQYENGVTERYFLLQSGDYELNAVYTYCQADKAPTVLLISGSGPNDYNETVGLLTPFKDIALGLAEEGVNSLRFEKRTLRYPREFTAKYGLDEEYFDDCRAAVLYLSGQEETDGIFLLGHSLGGQIAAVLADDVDAKGLILFSSSPRHLADIAADQMIAADPGKKEQYEAYAKATKEAAEDTAKGLNYYGAADYYWADYNRINVTEMLKDAGVPVLVVNSRADLQIFDTDIEQWQEKLSDADNVTIRIYDDLSHFGYRINAANTAELYRKADFPEELIKDFTEFIKAG